MGVGGPPPNRAIRVVCLLNGRAAGEQWQGSGKGSGIDYHRSPPNPNGRVIRRRVLINISFSSWRVDNVYSVPRQSQSFPHISSISTSHQTFPISDDKENFPPFDKGNTSKGSRQVICPRCNEYVNHGQDQVSLLVHMSHTMHVA